MNGTTELQVGDRVRLNAGTMDPRWEGLTATVVEVGTGQFPPRVRLDEGQTRPDGYTLDTFAWRDLEWLDDETVEPATDEPTTDEPSTDVAVTLESLVAWRDLAQENGRAFDEARAELADLRADLEETRTRARTNRERHERDIAAIGARLMEEAEHRNWCSEYDSIVNDLNAELTVELPNRSREYSVRVEMTYTYTIEARDDDDAREQVADLSPDDMDPYPSVETYIEEN